MIAEDQVGLFSRLLSAADSDNLAPTVDLSINGELFVKLKGMSSSYTSKILSTADGALAVSTSEGETDTFLFRANVPADFNTSELLKAAMNGNGETVVATAPNNSITFASNGQSTLLLVKYNKEKKELTTTALKPTNSGDIEERERLLRNGVPLSGITTQIILYDPKDSTISYTITEDNITELLQKMIHSRKLAGALFSCSDEIEFITYIENMKCHLYSEVNKGSFWLSNTLVTEIIKLAHSVGLLVSCDQLSQTIRSSKHPKRDTEASTFKMEVDEGDRVFVLIMGKNFFSSSKHTPESYGAVIRLATEHKSMPPAILHALINYGYTDLPKSKADLDLDKIILLELTPGVQNTLVFGFDQNCRSRIAPEKSTRFERAFLQLLTKQADLLDFTILDTQSSAATSTSSTSLSAPAANTSLPKVVSLGDFVDLVRGNSPAINEHS